MLIDYLRSQIRLETYTLRLLAASVPVAVVLALALPHLDLQLLTLGLGMALVGAGLYLNPRRTLRTWDDDTLRRRAIPFGLGAGILSGLYGMAGPVAIVFFAHAGPDPGTFRARITLISIVWSSVRVVTLMAGGAIGASELARFGVTVPVILLGLGAGMWLHPRIDARAFRLILALLVGIAGVVLVADTLLHWPPGGSPTL